MWEFCMDGACGSNIVASKKIENRGEAINTIRSDITLFSKENKMYSELNLFEKNWRIFAYNKYWENVFLKWPYKDPEHYNVYFTIINWENFVAFELSWNTNYYNENWDKVDEGFKITKITETIKECFLVLLWKNREDIAGLTEQIKK